MTMRKTPETHASPEAIAVDGLNRRRLLQGVLGGLAVSAFSWPAVACSSPRSARPAGFSAEGLERIRKIFEGMVAQDLHPGAQLAVYRSGELVLDLVAGVTEPGGKVPVTSRTLYQIRSTTKALTTLVMMQAYERGRFKFDDPVAKHWPEFAAHGKDKITIAHVMSHRAGIPDGPVIAPERFGRRDAVAEAVAAMKPIWEPGTKNGYHAATIGWICDELLYRWEGKAAPELLRTDFVEPLGLKDLYVGLPREQFSRMAMMDVHPEVRAQQAERARFSDALNTPEGIGLPLSWVAGVSTARDLGRLMNILAYEGTFEGRTYFKRETLVLMSSPTNSEGEMDQRLGASVRWGMGFLLGVERSSFTTKPHARAVGHSGGGACIAWADPEKRLSVAFLCNRMLGRASGRRNRDIGDAIYDALV